MNKIAFKDMNRKTRDLYECMWGNNTFDFPIEKTKTGNILSNNSYTFTNISSTDMDICGSRLAELFDIKNRDLFKEKFTQSCSGSGQELIRNLCDSPDCRQDAVANAISAGAKVLLGEILFTKGIGQLHIGSNEECLVSYQSKYRILSDILNKQLKEDRIDNRITVLSDIISYSQFRYKEYIQEPQIKRFYFECGKYR